MADTRDHEGRAVEPPPSNASYGLAKPTVYSTRKQAVIVLAGLTVITAIIILLSLCLYRGFCAADAAGSRTTYSAAVASAVVPSALVVMLVVAPVNACAARLQRAGLAIVALCVSAVATALLIAAGLGELAGLASSSTTAAGVWDTLSVSSRGTYGDSPSALEAEIRADMAGVGVSALVLAAIIGMLSFAQLGAVARAIARARHARAPADADDAPPRHICDDCWALSPDAFIDDFSGHSGAPPCAAALYDALGCAFLCADGRCGGAAACCSASSAVACGASVRGMCAGLAASCGPTAGGRQPPPQPPPPHRPAAADGGPSVLGAAMWAARAGAAAVASGARQLWAALPRVRLVVDRGGAPLPNQPQIGAPRRGSYGPAVAGGGRRPSTGGGGAAAPSVPIPRLSFGGGAGGWEDDRGAPSSAPPPAMAYTPTSRRFDYSSSARSGGGGGASSSASSVGRGVVAAPALPVGRGRAYRDDGSRAAPHATFYRESSSRPVPAAASPTRGTAW